MSFTKFNRVISCLLTIVILIGIIPFASFRAEAATGKGTKADPYVVKTYPELREYMANAPTDGTVCYIKLGCDLTSNDILNDNTLTLTHEDQNVVLDLAGYKIVRSSMVTVDYSVIRAKEGKLTINDSVGTGGVRAEGQIEYAIGLTSATGYVARDNGTIIVNGGTYESYYTGGAAVYNEAATIYITGGVFKGFRGLHVQAGRTCIYGGEFHSDLDYAIQFGYDQLIEAYNFTAYGPVSSNTTLTNLWDYFAETANLFVDGVMLQSRTPASIFNGNRIELVTNVIESINVTIDTPAPGGEIIKSAYVHPRASYQICEEYGSQIVAWMKDGNPISTSTYEPYTSYTVRIYIVAGTYVSINLTAKINGKEAKLEFAREEEGKKYYWLEYTFIQPVDSSKFFDDLKVNWAKEGIDYVVTYGYMSGVANRKFDQSGTMTRAMLVSVLWRIAGQPTPTITNPFTDLESKQTWYHNAVIWAYENKIVAGTSDTTFSPTTPVDREQMATFLFRFAKYMGYDTTKTVDISTYPDANKVSSWARESMAWANANGFISGATGKDGVTRLEPNGNATREQVASILMRFCKEYKVN